MATVSGSSKLKTLVTATTQRQQVTTGMANFHGMRDIPM
jgi:hypothetical protein